MMISKRDKALTYHQRILYFTMTLATDSSGSFSFPSSFVLIKLIAQNISKEAKSISRDWAMDSDLWAAGGTEPLPKFYVIFWGE